MTTQNLSCPFCSNPNPRWQREDDLVAGDGSIVCGSLSCGATMEADTEAKAWAMWDTRVSVPELREPASLAGRLLLVDEPTCSCDCDEPCPVHFVPTGARMAKCSLCKQEFPDDHLSAGVCATCRPNAWWAEVGRRDADASTHSEP